MIRGLKELRARMARYPEKLSAALKVTLDAAMLTLWEKVPPYPAPPEGSTYVRTGTLGRSLGSGQDGGKGGAEPDIFDVKKFGGKWEGHFGTNLDYAPYVIGDDTQAGQNSHWWIIGAVAERAVEKIDRLFASLEDKLAAFLDGKNG